MTCIATHRHTLRIATASLCFALPCVCFAQALPPSSATKLTSPASTSPSLQTSQTIRPATESQPVHHQQVRFDSGLLTVDTQNASLNEVLREISRVTGMRITGSIADERVFGNYGPASPQQVLSQLLEGTGSNILLHEDARHEVRELLLTARQGGVTPPNPSGNARDTDPDSSSTLGDRRHRFPGGVPDLSQAGSQGNQPGNVRQPPSESQPVVSPQNENQQIQPNGLPAPTPAAQQQWNRPHLGPQQNPPEE